MSQAASTLFLRETIRPTCLAFLLAKADKELLLKAIQRCSTLWGGCYNPILVLDQDGRIRLGTQEQFPIPVEDEILGTLRDFDPDFLVTLGTDELPEYLKAVFGSRHLREEDLVTELRPGYRSGVFLEVWPFVQNFWQDEIRGQSSDAGIRLVTSDHDPNLDAFVATQFGRYAREGSNRLLRERLGAKDIPFDPAFRNAFQLDDLVAPINLTTLGLVTLGQPAFVDSAFYLLNPTDLFDLTDYWNLRAAGMNLFPLAMSVMREYVEGIRGFVTRTKPRLPTHFDGEVIKARSVSDADLEDAAKWASDLSGLVVTRHGWSPRFGMELEYVSPDVTPVDIEAATSNQVVVLDQGHGHLLGGTPPCRSFDGPSYFQQWSSELEIYSNPSDEFTFRLPWLRPKCDELAAHHLGFGFGTDAGRVSRSGLVCHRRGSNRDSMVSQIPMREAVAAILRDRGFHFDGLSTAGVAAERIVGQLGGIQHSQVFRHLGVREVFGRLSHGGSLPAQEIRACLNRAHKQRRHGPTVDQLMDELVSKRALRAGLVFKCSSCGRHEWYHVSAFDERFRCKVCFADQDAPRLDNRKWQYRSDGLFAVKGKMAGCASVLLGILSIKGWLRSLQYYLSFHYKDVAQKHEADFICLSQDLLDRTRIIVGEAKTSQALTVDEVTSMSELARRLDATLAFCHLEGAFPDSDKEHFKRLRESGLQLILLDGSFLSAEYDEISNLRREAVKYGAGSGELARLSAFTTTHVIGSATTPPPKTKA